MTDPLNALDPPSRRTVEVFISCYLDRTAVGFSELFTEDGTFEGAYSGGVLKGRKLIEAHYRQMFMKTFAEGSVRIHEANVQGKQVVIVWEFTISKDGGDRSALGHTTLTLSAEGLIDRVKTEWDPRDLNGR